jgi:hypothetical protein
MNFRINPSLATIDLDSVTLTTFDLTPSADGSATLSISLTGGLGRLVIDRKHMLTDAVSEVTISGTFNEITAPQCADITTILNRWAGVNMPLRFLDFGGRAMLMEDEQQYLLLPPGPRHVQLLRPPEPLGDLDG